MHHFSSNPRRLTRSALIALALWLIAVAAFVLWRRPEFWIEPGERFRRAEALAHRQKWPDSLAAVESALAGDPNNAGYLTFKGYRQLDLGDIAGARQSFSRALERDRSLVEARLGSATALVRLGRYDDAAATLQSLSPETITASQLHRRSQLYSAMNARDAALADLSVLLHGDPGNEVFLKDAAEVALMIQDWDRAASFLQRLEWAAADPQTKRWAVENRGAALEAAAYHAAGEGRYLDAAAVFQDLVDHSPDNARFRRDRAYALRSAGQVREAEAMFRALLADHAADVATREAYAWLFNTQHRYAEAWQVIEPLPRPAQDTALLELQVRTAIWAGQAQESIQLIRALIDRRPNDAELWRRLAEAWQKMKDDRQAADALTVYLRLQSNDWRARERLAQILSRAGSLDNAIDEYRILLADDPDNPDFLRSLGLLYETAGDLEQAAKQYLHAIDVSSSAPPALLMRVARVHRWMKHPEAAVPWYKRYLEKETADAPLRHAAEAELALSLFESGDPAAAAARLRAIKGPLSADELVTAARAATANAQPAEATAYLELLGGLRTLTAPEELWLAGQYRAAGNPARALSLYERLRASAAAAAPDLLEAIGDLRYDAGDYAAAVSAFQQVGGDRIALKIARSAARAGDLSLASDTYERYVRSHPDDDIARLEAARHNANSGRPLIAIAHYLEYITTQGAADVRLELARAYLAAEQFESAERWAREAVAAGEDPDAARLALVQSLHLLGRHRDARGVLIEVLRDNPARSDAHEWRGYVAVALDRHLEAFRSFERAIALAGGEAPRLLILQGTAALKRGDYSRAAAGYTRAAAAGAEPAAVDAARRELRRLTLPTLDVPMWGLGDSNDLSVMQAGGGLFFFLPSLSGEIALEGARGSLSQRGYSAAVNSVRLTLSRLFPSPALNLDFAVGLSQYDRAPNLLTWHAGGLYEFGERAKMDVNVSRDAVLPLDERTELREFNRVLDLAALGPAFHSDLFRGAVELAGSSHRTRMETGLENFQDGNRRTFAYLHFQVPTANSARTWTAIRPNMFFETFRDRKPFYYSPSRHLTVGTMLHAIRRQGGWEIESELNPQLLFTDGATGAGGHGLVNLRGRVGPAVLSGGAFIFWDGLENHVQWRVGGRVSVPVAR